MMWYSELTVAVDCVFYLPPKQAYVASSACVCLCACVCCHCQVSATVNESCCGTDEKKK